MNYYRRVFISLTLPLRFSMICSLLLGSLAICGSTPLVAQTGEKRLPFRTAIELALKNSPATGISRYDQQRAKATLNQSKDFFLPSMVFGSGLGFSYGFPLSLEGAAPAICRRETCGSS